MILQKSGNMDVVIQTNTYARADCHSVGRGPAAEEVGMVARSQPTTKLIVEQIRIFRGIAGVIRPLFEVFQEFSTKRGAEICSSVLGQT